MNGETWPVIGTVVAALLAFLGTWLVQKNARRQSSTDVAQRLIDQMQEDREADRTQYAGERASLEARLDRAFQRIEQMETREHALFDYVSLLRWHIEQNSMGPPPPFPADLGRPSAH